MREAHAAITKALAEGKKDASFADYGIPPAPLKYTIMKWRQSMRVSPLEAFNTPFEVIMQDLDMLEIEAEYGPPMQ